MTNMGCYAIDYLVAMWGMPKSVQAKWQHTWPVYRKAKVENFGQIVCDYGDFFAVLGVGKQRLRSLPRLNVARALTPPYWHNLLELQFAEANFTVLPFQSVFLKDGAPVRIKEYLRGYRMLTPFQQLVRAIETGRPPDSNVTVARQGVELLMAAYRSIRHDGVLVKLPLADGQNPLVKK
jgi:predicted dehydrogenase